MDIRNDYPDFAPIEAQIRQARAERALYLSQLLVSGLERLARGVRRVASDLGNGLQADWEKRAIEADSFLKRSVPRH
jgi:hypothetical protein